MDKLRASMIGFLAILMWSSLALLTVSSGKIPPLQLSAICFAIGGSIGAISWIFRPGALRRVLQQKFSLYLLGCSAIFGYHFFYFTAIRISPPVEASLIAYLWPMLIIVFSALLPGERLKIHHIAGGLLALAGAVLVTTGGRSLSFQYEYMAGYVAAFSAALIWALYSVLSRHYKQAPVDVITIFCLLSSLLAIAAHIMLEETVWPVGTAEWTAVFLIGLFPLGAAFYAWDYGVKHGDIQTLGAASYAAPLLSTLALIIAGYGTFTWIIAAACLAITLGALLAAKDFIFKTNKF